MSSVHTKLAVLRFVSLIIKKLVIHYLDEFDIFFYFVFFFPFSYRCQALLFYKLFKMRKQESKEVQKVVSDYCSKVRNHTAPFLLIYSKLPHKVCTRK